MGNNQDYDYHNRRAEQHLQLAASATQIIVKTKHLDIASRHATLASLCGTAEADDQAGALPAQASPDSR